MVPCHSRIMALGILGGNALSAKYDVYRGKCANKISGCITSEFQNVVKHSVSPYSWRERLVLGADSV
jgi:hypothetical protein